MYFRFVKFVAINAMDSEEGSTIVVPTETVPREYMSLYDINDEEVRRLTAPIVYLSILLVIGVPGNMIVLIIYGRKYSKSVYRTIIWNIALMDFLFSIVALPFNIAELVHFYTFTELWACKTIAVVAIFFVLYSSHLLVIMAIYRFRQVCMPTKKQITLSNVKYWIVGGLILAILFDFPQGIFQPIVEVSLVHNVTGYVCPVSYKTSVNADIYNGFLTCLMASYSLFLLIAYLLIGHKMYLRYKRQNIAHSSNQTDQLSNKITKIAFAISIVFAVSYLPIFIIKLLASKIDHQNMNTIELSVLRIFERSYAVNHVTNTFIYAFYDKRFRKTFWSICTEVVHRKPSGSQSVKSSEYKITKDSSETVI